jgi:hypothetical protein
LTKQQAWNMLHKKQDQQVRVFAADTLKRGDGGRLRVN